MGMAASQARLLALTARITDVEFKAQQIQSQKLALATQKDELYERYCAALDATKIRVAFSNGDGSKNFINATFNTVCTYNPDRYRQYALQDNRSGLAIVDNKIKEVYDNYGGDKYSFAWKMLGFDHFNWLDGDVDADVIVNEHNSTDALGNCVGYGMNTNTQENFTYSPYADFADENILAMTPAEYEVYKQYCSDDTDDSKTLQALFEKWQNLRANGTVKEKKEALDNFRETLYTELGTQLYNMMNRNKQDNDRSVIATISDNTWDDYREEFNYYANLWEFIEQSGGCTTIEAQYEDGENGENWFNNMVEAGLVSIHEFNDEWKETSVSTSTNNNYLREEQDDTDLKKAEAEYEHELSTINDKDKKFDTELSKLETEREAIKKQMDSYKTIIKDNVEKSFGIFS